LPNNLRYISVTRNRERERGRGRARERNGGGGESFHSSSIEETILMKMVNVPLAIH